MLKRLRDNTYSNTFNCYAIQRILGWPGTLRAFDNSEGAQQPQEELEPNWYIVVIVVIC